MPEDNVTDEKDASHPWHADLDESVKIFSGITGVPPGDVKHYVCQCGCEVTQAIYADAPNAPAGNAVYFMFMVSMTDNPKMSGIWGIQTEEDCRELPGMLLRGYDKEGALEEFLFHSLILTQGLGKVLRELWRETRKPVS